MATNTVADQVVDMLARAGVKHLYAIPGDSLNAINDAVNRDGRIKWIHVRHEETGAFAAGAEALLGGRLGCCGGSSGPGHVHLVNGLYDCHRSYAPVVALASTCPSNEFGTGYFQETDTGKLFADCSYYNEVGSTPAQVARMLQQAMQTSLARGGVSVLGLPGDVTSQPVATVDSAESTFVSPMVPKASEAQVKEVSNMLNSTKKITIYAGSGAIGALDVVAELSEKLAAPVAGTFKGRMQVGTLPNFVGLNGLVGTKSGFRTVCDCDVLLMLGCDFPFPMYPTDKQIVQVDIRPEHIGRRCKVNMGVCADVAEFVTALLPLVDKHDDRVFLDASLALAKESRDALDKLAEDPGKPGLITPQYVMRAIDRIADKDAIFTVDTGMNCTWSAQYITPNGHRDMLASYFHGTMANAMPQAIGAQLACPERQVIAISGDGGISMLLGDLMTIAQYKLPVKVVVMDNDSLAMVRLEMMGAGFQPWETDMDNPGFDTVARAMGLAAYRATKPEDVVPTLSTALSTEGPALIMISTDKNATPPPLG
jgi:pyruvate dehydrogenase (quinone)